MLILNSFILKTIIISLLFIPSISNGERINSRSSFNHRTREYRQVPHQSYGIVRHSYNRPVVIYRETVVVYHEPIIVSREPIYYDSFDVTYRSPEFSFGLGIRNPSYYQNNYVYIRMR
jgi:hypothetical protein